MFAYAVRRLIAGVGVLFAASTLVFFAVAVSGDPLDPLRVTNPPAPPETIALRVHELHLDKPIWQRYWIWLTDLVAHGSFGNSVNDTVNIGPDLLDRALVTLRLILVAMLVAVVLAVVAGVISAVRQYSKTDYALTFTGFLFLAMPSFWLAILLKDAGIWVNRQTGGTIFYTLGDRSPFLANPSTWNTIKDIAGHMILPTLALALISYASWSRYQRASMLEVLGSDYVRLARAKGLRWGAVLRRHALRTALIPLVTVTALDIAGIIGGAVITETVFNWNGMGRFLLVAIAQRDVNVVMAWLVAAGIVVVVFNIAADLLYGVLDPRIRYG
jgi:peptide/nickel transport system permease protein